MAKAKTVAKKTIDCPTCNGTGDLECGPCNGSGENSIRDYEHDQSEAISGTYQCRECEGDGKVRCSACNGTGEVAGT